MIEVMAGDYIQMATLKGVPYWPMVFRHALPNALLLPINGGVNNRMVARRGCGN